MEFSIAWNQLQLSGGWMRTMRLPSLRNIVSYGAIGGAGAGPM